MTIIKTERLILRPWREDDLKPFALLNADPRVREFFPSLLNTEESNQLAKRMQSEFLENGWGMWVVSIIGGSDFIGFIGLNKLTQTNFPAHFTPAVEIGWRLAFETWNKGYATEGARAALKYAFETLELNEVVAFTAEHNKRSQRVMEKIGMHRNFEDDFDHPEIPEGHPLRRHVLYRIKASDSNR